MQQSTEIVKYAEEHKDDPSVTLEVLDMLRNLSDKRYNDEAELLLELNLIEKTLFKKDV